MVPQFSPAAAIAYVNVESARRFVRTRPIAEGMAQTGKMFTDGILQGANKKEQIRVLDVEPQDCKVRGG